MKIKDWMDQISNKLIRMEDSFEDYKRNHMAHHQKVILPFLIGATLLLIAILIRS